jgi:hypothetical protein
MKAVLPIWSAACLLVLLGLGSVSGQESGLIVPTAEEIRVFAEKY